MNTPNLAPIPTIWTTGTTESIMTGTWRAALPQHIRAPAPCHGACPVNGDIAEWIGLARARDFHGAWQVLTRHNPFPAIAGRICHHPCETACNRGSYDKALSICWNALSATKHWNRVGLSTSLIHRQRDAWRSLAAAHRVCQLRFSCVVVVSQ